MDHFAGLDVSVKETSVCIVDDTGKIVREVKVASEPDALLAVLKNPAYHFKRIGLEAGPLSQWLFSALAEAGFPVICVETRHMRAVLKAQINKTDRNDARGMAQMMRVGLYRPVHVKTLRSQKLRMPLTHRPWSCTASGWTAPSSGGPENKPQQQQHDNCAGSDPIGGNSSSTLRWKDVPRGTMDEVSSHVRLDLPLV